MADVSGTLRGVTLNGVAFNVMGDTDISEMGGAFEVEIIPTSGPGMKKMTRRNETRESVVVACSDSERELLQSLSEQIADFPMSYTTASGSTYQATGSIEFENRTSAENRATIKLLPRNGWQAFVA